MKVGAVLCIFTIRDTVMNVMRAPGFAPSIGAAMRSFADEVNREGSEFSKHPEDYELYDLGYYDESDASFALTLPPRLVCKGLDHRQAPVLDSRRGLN